MSRSALQGGLTENEEGMRVNPYNPKAAQKRMDFERATHDLAREPSSALDSTEIPGMGLTGGQEPPHLPHAQPVSTQGARASSRLCLPLHQPQAEASIQTESVAGVDAKGNWSSIIPSSTLQSSSGTCPNQPFQD
ncbi:hypothetical protein P7K49_034426 [Saguinus oedipus]|uniref:Uncharacterized protein n=1 Tax=Saguinus oedipus TaxID=9490 RepID=A0ABQ9TUQ7_SAGOE|nr:hypothetical protein P7K49_034426 [Saguinus oedipus]